MMAIGDQTVKELQARNLKVKIFEQEMTCWKINGTKRGKPVIFKTNAEIDAETNAERFTCGNFHKWSE